MKYDENNPFLHADAVKESVVNLHTHNLKDQTKTVQEALQKMQGEGILSYTFDFIVDPELVEYLEAAGYTVETTAERHLTGKQTTLIQVKW